MKVQMENKISQLESKLSLSETKLHEERAVTQALKQELHRVLQQHETVRNKDANPPTYQIMRIFSAVAPSLPKPPGRLHQASREAGLHSVTSALGGYNSLPGGYSSLPEPPGRRIGLSGSARILRDTCNARILRDSSMPESSKTPPPQASREAVTSREAVRPPGGPADLIRVRTCLLQ